MLAVPMLLGVASCGAPSGSKSADNTATASLEGPLNQAAAMPANTANDSAPESNASASKEAFTPAEVTKAGFPFEEGMYVATGTCKAIETGFEYRKTFRHEWEADNDEKIRKIMQTGPDNYTITFFLQPDEGAPSTYSEDLTRTGPHSFSVTRHQAYDDKGNMVKKDSTIQLSWCRKEAE
jgi:hypothetical protein